MENNNIYVTKKEFYSTIAGIFSVVLFIVAFSKKEFSWRECLLSLLVGANLIFFFYKFMREKSKTKSFSQIDK